MSVLLTNTFKVKDLIETLKKFDEKDTSIQGPSIMKQKMAKELYYTTKVRIKTSGMANLGDFTLNVSQNRKLITNVSFKYKDRKSESWSLGRNIEDEIIDKGDVLRSVIINTISNTENVHIDNRRIKRELVDTMNSYLSNSEVEEVYFNRFLIQ